VLGKKPFESSLRNHFENKWDSGSTPVPSYREIGPWGSHDCSGNWDHLI